MKMQFKVTATFAVTQTVAAESWHEAIDKVLTSYSHDELCFVGAKCENSVSKEQLAQADAEGG